LATLGGIDVRHSMIKSGGIRAADFLVPKSTLSRFYVPLDSFLTQAFKLLMDSKRRVWYGKGCNDRVRRTDITPMLGLRKRKEDRDGKSFEVQKLFGTICLSQLHSHNLNSTLAKRFHLHIFHSPCLNHYHSLSAILR